MTLALQVVRKLVDGQVHLDGIDIGLASGSFNVLLGPTLAGKTSLMRLMAGLDRPTTGKVIADGTDVTGVAVRKRSVAMVYQQFINYPSFTVYDNIASPLRLKGVGKDEVDRQVREAAGMLHIERFLDRLPAELSGGQQQRLSIARALVKHADLLLLDEPLVNLDYKLREELRSELRELFAERDAIVVYATTEPLEALMMGGNVIVMDEGRVLQQGPTAQVYQRPASIRVAQIFSDPPINVMHGEIKGGEARLEGDLAIPLTHHLAGLRDGSYTFGIRASHLAMSRRHDHDVETAAVVELAEISGSETFVHVGHGATNWVVQVEGVHEVHLGQPVSVFVNPASIYAFARSGTLEAAPDRPGMA